MSSMKLVYCPNPACQAGGCLDGNRPPLAPHRQVSRLRSHNPLGARALATRAPQPPTLAAAPETGTLPPPAHHILMIVLPPHTQGAETNAQRTKTQAKDHPAGAGRS